MNRAGARARRDAAIVVLEDDGGSSLVTMTEARRATRLNVMRLPARTLFTRPGRIDSPQVDRLVGAALLVGIEAQTWLNPASQHRVQEAVAGVVLAAAVTVRRRLPLGALLAGVGTVAGLDALGGRVTQHAIGAIPAAILCFYAAGAFLTERRAYLALVLGVTGLWIDVLLTTRAPADLFFDGIMIALLPWAVGRMLRERGARERAHRELAERIDAEREQRAWGAAHGERGRIARELHDVIAHSVSVMVIQAGGARIVMDSDPERAEASLLFVERAGREALAEMRRLLGVLGSDGRSLAPQPGLADLDDLVLRTRAAGLATDLEVEGTPWPLSPALDLCAYRIVQEALTNVLKHAGPAQAAVRIRWSRAALELEVADDGRGPHGNGSGGHGIDGMRERVALHGGRLQAGAGGERGFAVVAMLPLPGSTG